MSTRYPKGGLPHPRGHYGRIGPVIMQAYRTCRRFAEDRIDRTYIFRRRAEAVAGRSLPMAFGWDPAVPYP